VIRLGAFSLGRAANQDYFNSSRESFNLGVSDLPVVQVSAWAGMTERNKKKVVEGITRVLEELGIPREAVTVIIYEVPKTNWATGGHLHSEKYADR
jgi:4-oxalocrotonate tautomerase